MSVGSFALVLHSHLPYYRKAGKWPFGEENLHEAIAETYLPLLDAIHRLLDDGIEAKLTIGITPVLAEQLADAYLQDAFEEYLEDVLDRIERDRELYEDTDDPRAALSDYYHDWYTQKLDAFLNTYDRDVLGAFKALQDAGAVELITSAATHGFSPLLSRDSSLHAQFKVGVDTYEKHFGRKPKGVWLPECAYRPGRETGERRPPIDQFLYENGLQYFFTDFHAVEGGKTAGYRRQIGPYGTIDYIPMPERPASGLDTFQGYWLPDNPVAVFARHRKAGEQVWEADNGYPGDPWYREFHKKDSNSGMPYWRITGRTYQMDHKDYYDPKKAAGRIDENAHHYAGLVRELLERYRDEHGGDEGAITVPFDTELFGHWWFEGVDWIEHVIRYLHADGAVRRVTVSELMEVKPPSVAIDLPESTWGAGGHYKVWMNPHVEFMWPIIHRCESRMEELVRRFPEPPTPLAGRALNQAARELLLLEGSDWPFLVTTGQAKAYAIDRFNEHVERFENLADALVANVVTEDLVEDIHAIDNAFADLDYRVFRDRQDPLSAAS